MAQQNTSLRREVQKDLGIKDDRNIVGGLDAGLRGNLPGFGVVESGGSGGVTTEDDDLQEGQGSEAPEDLSRGINYFHTPASGDYSTDQEMDFDSAASRFDAMDEFLRYTVRTISMGLRVFPNNPNLAELHSEGGSDANDAIQKISLNVYRSGSRPFRHNGKNYTYPGGAKNLTAKIPGSGTSRLLIMLNPATLGASFETTGTSILAFNSSDLGGDVNDVSLWPSDYLPLALVDAKASWVTDASSEGIEESDIIDVRPFLEWGIANRFEEKLWSTVYQTRRYDFDAGVYPRDANVKNLFLFRNGQELVQGASYDYTFGFDSGLGKYYVELTVDPYSSERLLAKFVKE